MGDEQIGSFAVDLGDWFQAHATEVKANLERYFLGVGGAPFDGRHFERFSAMGDPNRFVATDVLAVEALSVEVPPNSAAKLIDTEAEDFNLLLRRIPADEDMWEVLRYHVQDSGPAAQLHARLKELDGIGSVTAGKLLASKRPRLIPVVDSEVSKVLKPPGGRFWLPMYNQLLDDRRRERINTVVSFPLGDVSLLRRIDVALWMHAKKAAT
jgi:hypothetical protein